MSRYDVRVKPMGYIRVVDIEKERIEGYWDQVDKRWIGQ